MTDADNRTKPGLAMTTASWAVSAPMATSAKTTAPAAGMDDDFTIDLDDGITLLFATPMLRLAMPDAAPVNAGLRTLILQKAQAQAGKTISNVGGWQSGNDLLEWAAPEIATLKGWIVGAVRRMAQHSPLFRDRAPGTTTFHAHAWANINRSGHYNRMHLHPGEHWSGVYYVDIGRPDPQVANNGVIEFPDPRPTARAMPVPGFKFDRGISVLPQPGMLLLFPSWLDHWVSPFQGAGERISIAFNCTLG